MNTRLRLLLIGLPLLLAVASMAPRHGFVDALRPGLLSADEDGDGMLDSTELARSSPVLTSFHKIDGDGDGLLNEVELLEHLLAEDPINFDGMHNQLVPTPHDHLRYSTSPKPVRVLRVLFQFMLAEAASVDGNIPLPSDEQVEAAAFTGSIESEQSLAVVANLIAAYQACGLELPAFLPEVEPQLAEPGLRKPQDQGPRRQGPRGQHPGQQKRKGDGPPAPGARPPQGGQPGSHPPPPFPERDKGRRR
jgi:hypothetical protein